MMIIPGDREAQSGWLTRSVWLWAGILGHWLRFIVSVISRDSEIFYSVKHTQTTLSIYIYFLLHFSYSISFPLLVSQNGRFKRVSWGCLCILDCFQGKPWWEVKLFLDCLILRYGKGINKIFSLVMFFTYKLFIYSYLYHHQFMVFVFAFILIF